jgi:uncharacterized protein YceH (UPF0502 family)
MSSDQTTPAATTAEWPVLTTAERRVLGVLVEKAKTTPDAYPLSINALTTGANQKSNRDPVMNLSDENVEDALASLQPRGHVTRIQGGRVERWRHNLYDLWAVNKVELAILAELLLRGPQTEGELRLRASRMEPIDDLDALRAALRPLSERKMVVFLGEAGRRGTQLTHGFHAAKELEALRSRAPVEDAAPGHAPPTRTGSDDIARLSADIADLRAQIQTIQETLQQTRQQLQALKDTLGG